MKRAFLLLSVLAAFASCSGGDQGSEVDVAVPVSVEEIALRPIEEFVVARHALLAAGTRPAIAGSGTT